MLLTIAISGYRTLKDVTLPLTRLTVITGPNGAGKSSLYRAIRLIADAAQGRIIGSLAQEGGLASALWAGPESFSRAMRASEAPVQGTLRRGPVALKLGFADEDYGYAIDLGLPIPSRTAFNGDPEIKAEALWAGQCLKRSNTIAERAGPSVRLLDSKGKRVPLRWSLASYDSMMTHAADPQGGQELLALRERMRGWRFYDHLRTDRDAPARRPQVGTRTTALTSDGGDAAAALQTIMEMGEADALTLAIDDAFPGASLEIGITDGGLFEIEMQQKGLLRPLKAAELSDGTLRYLMLSAALLSPRPPPLLVLNEPETSLHPDLLAPLGRLIGEASAKTQIIVVSHATALVNVLRDAPEVSVLALSKELGETSIADIERPPWAWPSRS